MHENSALILNNNFAIKSSDFESRVENMSRSAPLLVLVVPHAAHGGAFTKTRAKKPLKSKNADVLPAVAGN